MVAPAVAAVATTVIFFHRAVFGGRVFIARDILRVYYPLHQYWARRILHGQFPSWYPYDGLGEPFAGMLIASPFHPLKLFYLVLPLAPAMTLNVLTCFPIAFLGAYAFARRWGLEASSALLVAVVFAFGGYMICITNNLAYLMAAATIPWALWASDRFFDRPSVGRALAAGCLLALVLFAGDPQSFLLACAWSGGTALARRGLTGALLPVIGLFFLTALVGAVQILPAMQVAREGKPAHQRLEDAEVWSVHPLRAFDVALGPIFASESGDIAGAAIDRDLLKTSRTNLWVNSLHLGLPAVLLACIALGAFWRSGRTWLLAAATLTVGLLALGKHTPLYGLAFELVPGWRTFRYPEKLVPYVAFGVALAAGAGLHGVQSDERTRRRALIPLGLGVVLCIVLMVLEWRIALFSRVIAAPLWHGKPPQASLARLSAAFLHCTVQSTIAVFLVFSVVAFVSRRGFRGPLIVTVVFLTLLIANGAWYEVVSPAVLGPSAFLNAIRAAEGDFQLGGWRVYRLKSGYGTDYDRDPELGSLDERARFARSVETALDPVTPALWGLEGANKYLPGVSRRVADLADDEEEFATRYAALFGTRYLSLSEDDAEDMPKAKLELVAEYKPLSLVLFRHSAPHPRLYVAHPRCVQTPLRAFDAVANGHTLPQDEAIVECGTPLPAARSNAAELGEASIVSYAPERVEIRAKMASDALLVLNDAFYEGWTARVDGRPAAILPVNYAVRGVSLPPGDHAVLFTYRAPGLFLGGWITGLAVLGTLVASKAAGQQHSR